MLAVSATVWSIVVFFLWIAFVAAIAVGSFVVVKRFVTRSR